MNPWPFITAAYALTLGATATLTIAAFVVMRRSEAAADRARRP